MPVWLGIAAALLCSFGLLGCSSGSDGGATAPGPPTYWRDVKPIIDANCLPCHDHANIGPFALTDFAEVSVAAGAVKEATAAKTMPPWSPSDDCRAYDYKRELSEGQIATLASWVDSGAPQGDPADEGAPLTGKDPGLDRIDVTLEMPVTYTQIEYPDQQRCFAIDWPVDHLTYITGFGAQPGTAEVVHHIGVFVAGPDRLQTIANDDADDKGPGFDCFSGPRGSSFEIAAWVPGELGRTFPKGVGYEIKPGSQVILQMHYNTDSKATAQPDRSQVFFKIDDHVEKRAELIHFKGTDWVRDSDIPALSSDSAVQANVDIHRDDALEIQWVNVHQHYLGKSHHLNIAHADGTSECLVTVPKFSFYWQQDYLLSQPATLNPGDLLDTGCHWDNSPDNQRLVDGVPQISREVRWGTQSEEEMCIGTIMVVRK